MNLKKKNLSGNTEGHPKENLTSELINPVKPGRLLSLDALRGFDMLMIIGGGHLIQKVSNLNDWGWLDWLAGQMDHTRWHGFTFYDLIFPLFLFISGVSLAYSLVSQVNKGKPKNEIYLHAFRRMLILMFLGILYKNQPLHFDCGQIRYVSVLGRIGFTGFCVTLIVLNTKNFQQRLYWVLGLLVTYWAAMMFIPVPGFGAGNLTLEGNLAGFVDRALMPGKMIQGIFDENGFFEHIPATALVLIGALTGEFLRSPKFTDNKKVVLLALAGIVAIGLGMLWGLHFPINKRLWSSSFILATSGGCLVLLSLFYLIIDVFGYKKWAFFLVVIGLNSIVAYLAGKFINYSYTADYLLNGFYQISSEPVQHLIRELGVLTLEWLLLFFLYKKRIFAKI
jgi:predicted acyltransferase